MSFLSRWRQRLTQHASPADSTDRTNRSAYPQVGPDPVTSPVLSRTLIEPAAVVSDAGANEESADVRSPGPAATLSTPSPNRPPDGPDQPIGPGTVPRPLDSPSKLDLVAPFSVADAAPSTGVRETVAARPVRDDRVVAALELFDNDDPDRARAVLERIGLSGPLEAAGRDLLDLLLPEVAPPGLVDAILHLNDDDISLIERSRWLARRFDSTRADSDDAREAALDLLGAATMAGEAGWSVVQDPERRARIDEALRDPDDQIDLMEQEALAPATTGLPASVPGRALAFGRRMAAQGDLACVREAERLLHVLREPQLAYLLENERKQRVAWRDPLGARPTRSSDTPTDRLTVVLAGGHPSLRRMARQELDELDLADVRDFPSAWEGNRQGRHARNAVDGSDLAVVIWRQIAHSTADQVTSAARASSVPVVRADTPTVSAIRRAVSTFRRAGQR